MLKISPDVDKNVWSVVVYSLQNQTQNRGNCPSSKTVHFLVQRSRLKNSIKKQFELFELNSSI